MNRVLRRTKIVATLGPATDRPGELDKLLQAGVDVVRINMSHGTAADHQQRVKNVREAAARQKREVAVLVDLQGPKIRIGRFKEGKVELQEGDNFALDCRVGIADGDITQVGLIYTQLPQDVGPDDQLLLDDGRVVLQVVKVVGERVECRVLVGGDLSDNKGINLLGGGLSAAALTDKDKEDILIAAEMQADYLAISFPRTAEDVEVCRQLARQAGLEAHIVSKIERAEVVADDATLDAVILASDVVMIARGDLGVEVGDAKLPELQKKIIKRARHLNRITITATQMMESMIENAIPTRAEVFDVANAVMDGTDAVMLSGETATGRYPSRVVEAMSGICMEAEKSCTTRKSTHRIDQTFEAVDEIIAMASMYAANHSSIKCLAALTESGNTPLLMSRISSGLPIFALTPHVDTCRRVCLYRGVYPSLISYTGLNASEIRQQVLNQLLQEGVVQPGDRVLLTRGEQQGALGGTNRMEVITL
ncbi:MAG: pyruvate kinase [Marinospirillum sp.]|uniref:pyruvate kinase n=1 Tax=Marinospirillum sp. TaxID=2183934 RepID=UPI0019F2D171|nr:pyruvate kinase [Marinospirillum sp.]MBE0508770.1 pyruvate kinase [Marinospirillum sp.]